MKEKVLVVCPGRGSYTKENLGYFRQFPSQDSKAFIQNLDEWRTQSGFPSLTEMDSKTAFSVTLHTPGENASALIYACSLLDFMSIDRDRFEIVAVTGNSMGWYLALSCAQALGERQSYEVVQTMGAMMREKIIGGQIIYPVVDENWRRDRKAEQKAHDLVEEINAYTPGARCFVSIYLGGYLVLAGNENGLSQLQKKLPPIEHYPFKLVNHAAFHTPLLEEVSEKAFQILPQELFKTPEIPLIDGRGKIWMPYSTQVEDLYQYTLGHQVVAPYDFTASITCAIKEFAPTKIILLGPGNSLGGVIGQIIIDNEFQKIKNKADFLNMQKENPYLLSMGLPAQRNMVLKI